MIAKSGSSHGVCDFCLQTVFSSDKPWGNHHDNLASFEESARQCCILCVDLLREAQSRFPELSGEIHLPWPLFRWNIRRCVETRDVDDVRSIVFRPLHHDPGGAEQEITDTIDDKIFYVYHISDHRDIPDKENLGSSTDSPESWTQVRTWVTTCMKSHPQCEVKQNIPTPLPTRLLDVSEIDVNAGDDQHGHMRLVNTKSQNIKGPYTTISHSWGKGRSFITVKAENQEEMMRVGMTLNDNRLTKNFRDAIRVTRKLGINYIWMDSICILQQNKADFKLEAPKMHIYYRHTYCNIAAADSIDPDQGLFRERGSKQGVYPSIPAQFESLAGNKIFGQASWYIVPGDLWKTELLAEPLYKRGWVFQERMLAPRIVHFAKDQIFFECAEITACESLPGGLLRGLDARAATDRYWRQRLHHNLMAKSRPIYGNPETKARQIHGTAEISIEELWKTSIGTYTRCELTDGNDKLSAISGVAVTVGQFLGEAYADGLWAAALERQLAWRVVDLMQANGGPSKRPHPPRCPSWSWASVDGIIELQDRLVEYDYRVVGHDENPIKFEESRTTVTASVPSVLAQESKSTGDANTTSTSILDSAREVTSSNIDGTSVRQLLELSSIKIKGFLRQGQVVYNSVSEVWMLQTPRNDGDPCDEGEDPVKVALDELPMQVPYICYFMVLFYNKFDKSQSDATNHILDDDLADVADAGTTASSESPSPDAELPPTFSGNGLILKRISDNHFQRTGTFEFEDVFEHVLTRMIAIDSALTQHDSSTTDIFLH